MGSISTQIRNGFVPTTLKENMVEHAAGRLPVRMGHGIRTKPERSGYPGILQYDLSVLAAATYKNHARKTDGTILVISKINL